MAFLSPTIAYLHSIFEGSTPSTPSSVNVQRVRSRLSENDPFAAAFHAANYDKPTLEDEQAADAFNLFCDVPSSPSDPRFFELSPPDSDNCSSALEQDTSTVIFHKHQNTLNRAQYPAGNPVADNVPQASNQPYLLPPTPPTIVYESPYANPSPDPANVPTQLKQRRRGPKPKNLARTAAEKEEARTKFLERNKHAAKRCRERKKLGVEATLQQLREQEDAVLQLQMEKDLLEEEVIRLRTALDSCVCVSKSKRNDSIDEYEEKEEDGDGDQGMEDWLVSSPRADEMDKGEMIMEPAES